MVYRQRITIITFTYIQLWIDKYRMNRSKTSKKFIVVVSCCEFPYDVTN